MSPITRSYDAPQRAGEDVNLPMAAETKIYIGSLVATDDAGHALPAADVAGLKVHGRSQHEVDNSEGEAGDQEIVVRRGCFKYSNSATNPVLQEHVGKPCYVEDDSIVAADSDNLVVAGLVLQVEDGDVWVDTRLAQALSAESSD